MGFDTSKGKEDEWIKAHFPELLDQPEDEPLLLTPIGAKQEGVRSSVSSVRDWSDYGFHPEFDCNGFPEIPKGMMSIVHHDFQGEISWTPSRIITFAHPRQRSLEEGVGGGEVLKYAKKHPEYRHLLLNACMLDYLIATPCNIPAAWEGEYYFPGTLYLDDASMLCVRGIRQLPDGTWEPCSRRLKALWYANQKFVAHLDVHTNTVLKKRLPPQ